MKHGSWTVGLAGLVLALGATAAMAEQHVVPEQAIERAFAAADNERSSDLATLDRALGTERAKAAAAQVGVDLARLRLALPTLGSDELKDLATRAQALDQNPAAGVTEDVNQLLVIFLIIAIVILVLQAVD
jgi:hypothetical protein